MSIYTFSWFLGNTPRPVYASRRSETPQIDMNLRFDFRLISRFSVIPWRDMIKPMIFIDIRFWYTKRRLYFDANHFACCENSRHADAHTKGITIGDDAMDEDDVNTDSWRNAAYSNFHAMRSNA